jgi:hypothetical protein
MSENETELNVSKYLIRINLIDENCSNNQESLNIIKSTKLHSMISLIYIKYSIFLFF